MPKEEKVTPVKPVEAKEEHSFASEAPANIPRVDESAVAVGGSPLPDLDEYEGLYKRKSDGENYALAIVLDDRLERTHKCVNTLHFWEGTEAQFRENFSNEDGSAIQEAKESKKKPKAAKK